MGHHSAIHHIAAVTIQRWARRRCEITRNIRLLALLHLLHHEDTCDDVAAVLHQLTSHGKAIDTPLLVTLLTMYGEHLHQENYTRRLMLESYDDLLRGASAKAQRTVKQHNAMRRLVLLPDNQLGALLEELLEDPSPNTETDTLHHCLGAAAMTWLIENDTPPSANTCAREAKHVASRFVSGSALREGLRCALGTERWSMASAPPQKAPSPKLTPLMPIEKSPYHTRGAKRRGKERGTTEAKAKEEENYNAKGLQSVERVMENAEEDPTLADVPPLPRAPCLHRSDQHSDPRAPLSPLAPRKETTALPSKGKDHLMDEDGRKKGTEKVHDSDDDEKESLASTLSSSPSNSSDDYDDDRYFKRREERDKARVAAIAALLEMEIPVNEKEVAVETKATVEEPLLGDSIRETDVHDSYMKLFGDVGDVAFPALATAHMKSHTDMMPRCCVVCELDDSNNNNNNTDLIACSCGSDVHESCAERREDGTFHCSKFCKVN